MPSVCCKICSNSFYVKPSHLLLGYGKYCSKACQAKGQLQGKLVACSMCSKPTWKQPKDLKHSKSGKFFCGKKCQTIWRNKVYSGENHPFWKNGENIYRNILLRAKILQICKRCDISDKRILAVHHLDQNRENNKFENLVWLCHNCHYLIHHDKKEKEKFMVSVA